MVPGPIQHLGKIPGRGSIDLTPIKESAKKAGRGGTEKAPTPRKQIKKEAVSQSADGPYGNDSSTFGRYQNVANCVHMLVRQVRVSSGATHTVDWQMNLRGGIGRRPEEGWRRYFSKKQPTFDAIQEVCSPTNEAYQKRANTPDCCSFDRSKGGIKIATIRDTPASFHRSSGCEGSQGGIWRHMKQGEPGRPAADRNTVQHQSSLRVQKGYEGQPNNISDSRNDACVVEMLGKKTWNDSRARDPLAHPPSEGGDAKLYQLHFLKVESQPDEGNRKLRMSKTPRRDEKKCPPALRIKSPRPDATPRSKLKD
eukprot:TRINITY_DN12263_c2_g1_i1.p1 TRINITY_DN12263_c2_g1~~TRINITY_DN12263_c2_g1_i1.p1  ORF type:complete len:334 (+),score=37.93 TRINITY_DN12263_c2_g1_i1:73-1002(+)